MIEIPNLHNYDHHHHPTVLMHLEEGFFVNAEAGLQQPWAEGKGGGGEIPGNFMATAIDLTTVCKKKNLLPSFIIF